MTGPRVLYFGMFGQLSRMPLQALLEAGSEVCAVVVPPDGPVAGERDGPWHELRPPADWSPRPASIAAMLRRTAVDVAWERSIPVLEVRQLRDATVGRMLVALAPDLIAVSCFPSVIPASLLAAPLGAINLHPSPLPRGRGPAPLFWAFRERDDDDPWGVTVHLMERRLDAGPIVAQELFPLPDGMTQNELDLLVATRGADLLARAVRDLASGAAVPRAQDEAAATTHPWPTADDFLVRTERSARWAFNCIRGTAGWGQPHRLVVGERRWLVRAALGYEPDATLLAPLVEAEGTVRVRCNPGVLMVAVAGGA